jgi:GntR family transcriptional regulator, carbon starvation induced regulator
VDRKLTPGKINYTTLTEQLEEALRVDILEGVLQPGQRIRANEMTEQYGVSATPLREALQRLAVKKLVELDPRLGATVAPISEEDLTDIYDMLQLLDSLALERSIQRGDDEWVDRMDATFGRLSELIEQQEEVTESTPDATRRRIGLELSDAHSAFHEALYSACDSTWLMHFVDQLRKHAERYRMLTMMQPQGGGVLRNSRKEHEEIYKAAKRRDADAATTALRTHMARTVEILRKNLAAKESGAAEAPAASARASSRAVARPMPQARAAAIDETA